MGEYDIDTRKIAQEQTTIVQEENAAYEEGVIGQADVVTEDVVQQADGIAEVGDNSAVKRYSVKVGGETYTMIVSGGMQPVNQALEILYQILPYILGICYCSFHIVCTGGIPLFDISDR